MKNKQNGFTLLELMVTVAIVGIIASIAIWNSSDMLEENRAENFLLELKRNISYARAQAASTDEIVIICPAPITRVETNRFFKCQSSWGEDSIITLFVDTNNNGIYNWKKDTILRTMEQINSIDKIKFTGDSSLRFNTSGRVTTSMNNTDDFTGFIYCPNSDNKNNKALNVSVSGTAFYLGDTTIKCD